MISGKLPAPVFRLLLEKGQYELPPHKARLLGPILASPLPLAFLVATALAASQGESTSGAAGYFEGVYVLAVSIASIVTARRIRRPL